FLQAVALARRQVAPVERSQQIGDATVLHKQRSPGRFGWMSRHYGHDFQPVNDLLDELAHLPGRRDFA
ncbi:hypothetical protein OFN25_31815, partial [Escherichia coli]|nr:hypothetical protein [Escherichia coli]